MQRGRKRKYDRVSRSEDNVPKEALGVIDLSGSPSFTNSMINEAQALKGNLGEGAQGAADSFNNFFDSLDSAASEDVTGLGDLPASMLHHEAFLRYREEFKSHEAETRELAEKRDAYKLLNEKSQAELEAARRKNFDLVKQVRIVFEVSDDKSDLIANDPCPQDQKKLDVIKQLRGKVDAVKIETEEWKKNVDRLASEKETARTQLASAEVQLRAVKEKNLTQAKRIEGLQSQLSSAVSSQENLAKELEATNSEVITARSEADKKVAQLKVDVDAIQEQAKNMVKHARWESRRETLEGVHA
ncbi:protein BLISTER-like [Nicotiana tomentosiformis]|uniref:protein BLISTER-like n=1 Tax=Nicotiana tomentosiformis TaxID=4098 RepID=UPI00388CA5CB